MRISALSNTEFGNGRIKLVISHNQGFFVTIPENSLSLTRIQLVLREPTLQIKPFECETVAQSMR